MLDHMLSSSLGVDVEPKLGWVRSFRPDESVVHELRFVFPVIRDWMAMFVALVFVADARTHTLARLSQDLVFSFPFAVRMLPRRSTGNHQHPAVFERTSGRK